MPVYPFFQVDAFTDRLLGGNPCAVLLDTQSLDDAAMLAIARENNLSETAFLRASTVADFAARYFTPASEIPFAGHPTIASVFAMFDSGRLTTKGDLTHITLELKVGVIPIEVHASGALIRQIVMSQKKPEFLRIYEPTEVMPVFYLTPEDVLPGALIQTVSTGTPQLMVPLTSFEALRNARIDLPAYLDLRARADFFSPHLFCLGGATEAGSTFARHLDVPPDLPEDPFTGSATGGMAAYLWRYGWIDAPVFVAEQGHWMSRPGKAFVEVVGDRDDIQTVRVGGSAVTIIRGLFYT